MAAAGASGGLLLLLVVACAAYNDAGELPQISRQSFPKGFIFGRPRHPISPRMAQRREAKDQASSMSLGSSALMAMHLASWHQAGVRTGRWENAVLEIQGGSLILHAIIYYLPTRKLFLPNYAR